MRATTTYSLGLLLGGLLWLAAGLAGASAPSGAALRAAGLLPLVAGFAAGGYLLVGTAPVWLRAVVSIATPLLALAVWQAVADTVGGVSAALLGAGLALALVGAARLRRAMPAPRPPGRRAATAAPRSRRAAR